MTDDKEIPEFWQIKKLGEICHTTSGGTPSRSNSKYYKGTIPWVKSGELDKGVIFDTEEKISEEAVKNSSAKIFPKGTLLIALYGATIGKLAFLGVDAATNQAICGIYKNESIDSNYLFNFLLFKKPSLVKQGIGGAQPNISQGILKNLDIPLPPLPEQHRIVQKIEELFSELDNGKQQLETAREQLKVYRQSLLKWAFEGKLTNKNVKVGVLPLGWCFNKLGEVCKLKNGFAFKSDDYSDNGIPVIRISDINGGIVSSIKSVRVKPENEYENYLVENKDILVAMSGATTGKFGIYKSTEKAYQNQRVGKFKILDDTILNNEFLYYQINSLKRQIEKDAYGGAQPNISSGKIEQMQIVLPPISEQELIVDELESKLTVCDKIEETISHSIQQAEALRQSILKKAFEGKLVPQNLEDLPAEGSLKKIN